MSKESIKVPEIVLDCVTEVHKETPFERTDAGVRNGLNRLAVMLDSYKDIEDIKIRRGKLEVPYVGSSVITLQDSRTLWLDVNGLRVDPFHGVLDQEYRQRLVDVVLFNEGSIRDITPDIIEKPEAYPLGLSEAALSAAGIFHIKQEAMLLKLRMN